MEESKTSDKNDVVLVEYEVHKDIEKPNTYFIKANQETLKIFLELMDDYVTQNKLIVEVEENVTH